MKQADVIVGSELVTKVSGKRQEVIVVSGPFPCTATSGVFFYVRSLATGKQLIRKPRQLQIPGAKHVSRAASAESERLVRVCETSISGYGDILASWIRGS